MSTPTFTAFEGTRRIAGGPLDAVCIPAARAARRGKQPVLVFADATGRVVDLDLRGSDRELRDRARLQAGELAREETEQRRGPGRPRLGVVGREVTLLPRHWAWLNAQPGGASATLRRLIEKARRETEGRDRTRGARDVTYRFMAAMAGDLPGYEESLRALYRGDREAFLDGIAGWPDDLVAHVEKLTAEAFGGGDRAARRGAETG
jgi:hypothetical protein